MFLQAAVNGARDLASHAGLPRTPEDIAAAARAAVDAGAREVHLHVRDEHGVETLHPAVVACVLQLVRAACPDVPIGVSTGEWIAGSAARRFELVDSWPVLPDYVSVNFDEIGAVRLAEMLLERGVDIEAGLCEVAAAEVLAESGVGPRCLRFLIEPGEATVAEALAHARAMEEVLLPDCSSVPRLLHGFDATAWPLFDHATAHGYQVRMGLEDTVLLRSGAIAADNAALIGEARGRGA